MKLVGTTEVNLNFFEKVPENLEIFLRSHEISFTTVREYKPALDVKATRARLSLGGVDSDCHCRDYRGANPSKVAPL